MISVLELNIRAEFYLASTVTFWCQNTEMAIAILILAVDFLLPNDICAHLFEFI